MLLGNIDAQFIKGKRIKSRAVGPVGNFCSGAGKTGKKYCNSDTSFQCDATGLYVG